MPRGAETGEKKWLVMISWRRREKKLCIVLFIFVQSTSLFSTLFFLVPQANNNKARNKLGELIGLDFFFWTQNSNELNKREERKEKKCLLSFFFFSAGKKISIRIDYKKEADFVKKKRNSIPRIGAHISIISLWSDTCAHKIIKCEYIPGKRSNMIRSKVIRFRIGNGENR